MSLSSILAGFKKGLSKVATEANLFREAAADTGSKAFDAVQNAKQGVTDYAKGVVDKEVALQAKDPTVGARPLYDIVGDFRKADAEYKASGNRSGIVDLISGVANAPISIAEGISTVKDKNKTVAQKAKAVTDAGLGVVSLTPAVAGYQAAYNLFAPQAAKQSVERGSSTIIDNLSTTGQALGLSKDNADAVGGMIFNLASIYAGVKGPKVGSAVEKSVSSAGKIPAKTAGIFANAAVQASPNLFSMAVDHLQNGGDLSNADAIYDTMAQSLAMVPMGKVKGLSSKLAYKPKIKEVKIDDTSTTKQTTLAPIKTFSKLADEIGIHQNELYGEPYARGEQLYRNDQLDDIIRTIRDERNFNLLRRISPELMPDDVRAAVENYKIQGEVGVTGKKNRSQQAKKEAAQERSMELNSKGLSAKLQKDAPVEQMTLPDEGADGSIAKMDIDAEVAKTITKTKELGDRVTTETEMATPPVKEKKTKAKKGLSAKLETPIAPVIESQKFTGDVQSTVDASTAAMKESVINDINKLQENIRQLQENGISTKKEEAQITNLKKIWSITDQELAKSPADPTLSTPETPTAPVNDAVVENAKLDEASLLNSKIPKSISPEDYNFYLEESSYLSNNKDKYGNLLDKKESAAVVKERKAVLQDIESKLSPSELIQIKKDSADYVPLPSDTSNGFDTPKNPGTPSLSQSLSDISNSLSLDNVSVSRSKNVANSAGTIGGYVEKGLSKVLNRDINLRNITQSARNSMSLFANKILEGVGVDKTQPTIIRKIDIKPEDVVGGVTPNESTKISSYNDVKAVLDDIIPAAIKNFVGKGAVKGLENQAKAEYIYEVNKGDPAKLDALLTKDEQAAVQSRIAARDKASSDLAQHLVDSGFLSDKDLADNYVRYVLSEAGRTKLKTADSVTIAINGKDYKFDNIEQALTSMMARRKTGDKHVSDSMETAIASILKEKSVGVDKMRVHSPTVQLLSYAMEVGKLLQNKAVLDNFRKFQKGADGLPTPESKFIEGLFPDHGPSEKLENIIGINRRDASIAGQAGELMSNITKKTSTAILAGRVATAIQPFFSSVPKGGLVALKNIFTGNGVSLSGIRDPKVGEILDANGFTPDYQVFDTSGAGQVEGAMHWVAAESSGRTPELAAKTYTSLSEMRRVLNDNGVKTSSSPGDIVTAWETWARNPKNKDQYLVAQDRIQETLDWMGGSTIFNKSMSDILRKTNFQALTGYTNGQVNKAMSDVGRALGIIETGTRGSGQQADAVKRLAGTAAIWGIVAAGAYAYAKSQNPEASEDALLDIATQYANKQAGNPLQSWYAITSGVTDSPGAAGLGILKDSLVTGYSFLTDSPDKKVQADMLLNNIIKLQGGLSTADTISGGAITQGVADAIGTVNTSDITAVGNARGVKDTGLSAALLGFKPKTMMQNYLYGKMNEESLRNSLGVKDGFIGDSIVGAATLGKEWIRKVMTPIQDLGNSFTPDRTDWGRMQSIHDTYKKLTLNDTATSFLGKIGINDPKLQALFTEEIGALIKTEKGAVKKGSATGNEFAALLTQVGGNQRIVVDNFGKMMGDIEISNPYLYNQILAGATSLSQEIARRGGEFPADKNTAAVVKELMSKSSSKDDAAIAGITQHNPNSTAFSNALWNAFSGIVGNTPTAKDTQKGLKFLDSIMGEVYKGGQYTTGLERSIALQAFSTLPGIADRIKEYGGEAISQILSGMPFLEHALEQGLRYRGWVPDGTTPPPAPVSSTGRGLSSKLSGTGTTPLSTLIPSAPMTVAPTGKKDKKGLKLDLKDKYYRAEPGKTGKVLSLTELLSRK